MSKTPCANFIATALQAAFLIANEVTSANQLDTYSQEIYSDLSAETVLQQMSTAGFVNAAGATAPAAPGTIVYAEANYNVDGSGYSTIDFFNAFFTLGNTAQYQAVIHEAMHLVWNLSDQAFAKALGVYTTDATASQNWNAKLQENCK